MYSWRKCKSTAGEGVKGREQNVFPWVGKNLLGGDGNVFGQEICNWRRCATVEREYR